MLLADFCKKFLLFYVQLLQLNTKGETLSKQENYENEILKDKWQRQVELSCGMEPKAEVKQSQRQGIRRK